MQRDALETLELIAMARAAEANQELEARIGFKAGELRTAAFTASTVRVRAMRKIGETALPEAVAFLERLRQSDFASDPSQTIWPASQIALHDARLRQISDPNMQIEFLEHDVTSGNAATFWAVNELCDRGSTRSLPLVDRYLRARKSGVDGEDDVEFCEGRIRAVTSSSDPIEAIASVLDVRRNIGGPQPRITDPGQRLIGWAVNRLNEMHSARADGALDRFAKEIEALPDGSWRKTSLNSFRQTILNFQQERSERR